MGHTGQGALLWYRSTYETGVQLSWYVAPGKVHVHKRRT